MPTRYIPKEDIVKLYILMQNIKHCARMEGWLDAINAKHELKDYQDTRHKYWKNFMEIIYEVYGSKDDFFKDLQSWFDDYFSIEDKVKIGPIREDQ